MNDLITEISIPQLQMLPDGRMDTSNTSIYLGIARKTLASWRSKGKGPRFIDRGRIFYYKADLDDWLNGAGRFTSTAQARFHLENSDDE